MEISPDRVEKLAALIGGGGDAPVRVPTIRAVESFLHGETPSIVAGFVREDDLGNEVRDVFAITHSEFLIYVRTTVRGPHGLRPGVLNPDEGDLVAWARPLRDVRTLHVTSISPLGRGYWEPAYRIGAGEHSVMLPADGATNVFGVERMVRKLLAAPVFT